MAFPPEDFFWSIGADLMALHLFCCLFMTGLIWTMQLVHYPAFRFVEPTRFADFHRFHSSRMTWVAAPVMTLELLTAALIAWTGSTLAYINLASVLLVWLLTFAVSVPLHNRLSKPREGEATEDQNAKTIRRLILSNWSRTAVWTLRSLLLTALLAHTLRYALQVS